MPKPSHIYQTYIRCTPEAAWNAITDGDVTVRYFYGTRVESTWEVGSPIRYLAADGSAVATGEILAFDPPTRLELTFLPHWDPALADEGASHQGWIVEDVDGLTRVTVEYYGLGGDSKSAADFMEGIPLIVAGMKTLLETGTALSG